MTEADWWAATNPETLIDWLFFDARAADRKLRLFSVTCCERVRHLITDPRILTALDLTEAFADERTDAATLAAAAAIGWRKFYVERVWPSRAVENAENVCLHAAGPSVRDRNRDEYERDDNVPDAGTVSHWVVRSIGLDHPSDECLDPRAELDRRVRLFRDIFGSSTVTDHPSKGYLAAKAELARHVRLLHDIFGPLPFRDVPLNSDWLTSTVLALARGIYGEKAFDRMPILADALQDAGCDNDEMLSHCRREGWEHVRGCWVLDLLLGRPWRESARG
jgi:hypothetical protein